MSYYEIKVNGRFHDVVYYENNKSVKEVKEEFQKLLNTQNVRVLKRSSI
jgi:hypothetical protein